MTEEHWNEHVGKSVLVETATLYYAGTLVHVGLRELVMRDVAYIANTGRKMPAITNGEFAEVEPITTTSGPHARSHLVMRSATCNVLPLSRPPGPWTQR